MADEKSTVNCIWCGGPTIETNTRDFVIYRCMNDECIDQDKSKKVN